MPETKGCSFACDLIGGVMSSEAFNSFIVLFEVGIAKDGAGEGTRDDGTVGEVVGDLFSNPGSGAFCGVKTEVLFVRLVGD